MLLRQTLLTAGSVTRQHGACSWGLSDEREDELTPAVKNALWGVVMAAAEVTVSSGDVMTVKEEEEGDSSGINQNTQVILHLQPILHGINDAIADTGTTVLAIETHHDSKAEGEEIEYGYPITCGDSRAVLLFKKFVCPGINVRCVKFNDQLISPKQFVHLAGKATLKDWKRAIRLGGVMLSMRLPPGTSVQPSLSCLALDLLGGRVPPPTVLSGAAVHDAAEVEEPLEKKFSASAEWSPCPAREANSTTANGHGAKRKTGDTPDGVLSLWRGVADSGLMGEVLSSLQTELLATLKGVEVRSEKASLQEKDADILNSLCKMFGLLDSVKRALDLKRSHDEENKIHTNVYVSEDILEERRRQGCDESTSYKTLSSKHLRPQRHNPSNSQTHHLLPPVKTRPTPQPLSVTGLSAAAYAQLLINPQLFTHFSASTVQRHHIRAGRRDRDGHDAPLRREHEFSEPGNQEKLRRLVQEGEEGEDTLDIHKELGRRTVKYREDPRLRSEDVEETEGLYVIDRVVLGRKASKKHKSKLGRESISKGCWTK
ncbi:glucocorticoid modulatory element-binding protein 1-like isoform X2 [Cyclopterus lumpus]|uniref:glucocorticoid modulatory element-binding protein 1-like isoform X2 n=1 Tax=Cyclopterus lumpus TaxID=8103 RepID=UPI0014872985|nr:glucocorticoid modulatory element-binding protein 1-like isoform X2 [Cyclopterus lumpus]